MMESGEEYYLSVIKRLNESIWERRVSLQSIERWLQHFNGTALSRESERLHALYLLSNFMYFGSPQIREMLKSLYRSFIEYPIVAEIRRQHADTTDLPFLSAKYTAALRRTRFIGIGNPSESGCHLLYYFRQENRLPRQLFIHSHDIFRHDPSTHRVALADPRVNRYVFIDDFCGSGTQGEAYSQNIVKSIKSLSPQVSTEYYMLFATTGGLSHLAQNTEFGSIAAVSELDPSYRCFESGSRYFACPPFGIRLSDAEQLCRSYGALLCADHPLGYRDSQLLIGFHHNIPDNSLPILWCPPPLGMNWAPVFHRYEKLDWA